MYGKVLELCRVFRNAENLFLIKKKFGSLVHQRPLSVSFQRRVRTDD